MVASPSPSGARAERAPLAGFAGVGGCWLIILGRVLAGRLVGRCPAAAP